MNSTILFQDRQRQPILQRPRDGLADFWIDYFGQRMGDRHRAILALGNRFYGIGSMKSKQHCAAAIHLQVEMTDGNIVAWGEEEFNTTVLPDLTLLMFGG